jgi:hypothetical protein
VTFPDANNSEFLFIDDKKANGGVVVPVYSIIKGVSSLLVIVFVGLKA